MTDLGRRVRARRGRGSCGPQPARAPWWVALALAFVACADGPPEALGTLEYDRVTLPSPASERIIAIEVREGERVQAGQVLLRLDPTRILSATRAREAEAARLRERATELEAGPRREEIEQARAELAAAQAQAREVQDELARFEQLGRQGAIAPVEVTRARAAADDATARVQRARAVLEELETGTRPEQLAQGEAAARAAEAQASAQEVSLEELTVVAPRDGLVDSLPYEIGDRAPVGAPLAILLVGPAPYARIYVPEPVRVDVHVGQRARVFVDGRDKPFDGRVRMIRSEPSFTPYYALIGDDAARLSYLAEVQLTEPDAADLPAGLPVRVELAVEDTT